MTTTASPPGPVSEPATPAGVPPDPAHPAARPALLRCGDTVVGAAFAAEEATTDLVAGLGRVVQRRRRDVARLAERGARERARWQHRAEVAAEAAVAAVATSSIIDRVVDSQLQRVLRPVVLAVLDDVLLLLEREPERVRTLIRGQRETMVDELVGRLRAGAEAGDTAIDRLTFQAFRRRPRTQPAPPPEL